MKIGLFFGSFNPIHHGHLIIGKTIVESKLVDELWYVVSPQNPFKNENSLLNARHRLNLVRTALEGEHKLKASDIEFNLPKPSFTVNTLVYLKEKYPQHEFLIVLGSDGFLNIKKWKNSDFIIGNYHFLVYNRPGNILDLNEMVKFSVVEGPLLSISSTYIRKNILEGKNIRFLVPDSVVEEIEKNNFYRGDLEKESG
jgi:nicotinate-nucleotide adenylyltransferase